MAAVPHTATSVAALGPPLARGWTAEIYPFGPDRVLKLLQAGRPQLMAEREASLGDLTRRAGIPAPAAYGTLEIEGRFGVVFERVDGPTMLEVITARPWLVPRLAAQLGALHARVHRAPVPPDAGLRRLTDELRRKIGRVTLLSDAERTAALDQLSLLERQPGQLRLCHGDFHPGNVVLTPRGLVIIDWNDAMLGPPAADVARTRMLFLHGGDPPLVRGAKRRAAHTLRTALFALPLHRYHASSGIDQREVAKWQLPVTAARILEVTAHRSR